MRCAVTFLSKPHMCVEESLKKHVLG
nr:TPA_asm: m170l uoORF [Murid betaherpesvirus 1]DBA08155.1 TPA_asm: m170l uoORF [Murid betaherpesvirus 1]